MHFRLAETRSFSDSQTQLIRYRLQIKPGRWAPGVSSGAPQQQPEPRREYRALEAIDTPSIMCHAAASLFLFPPSCSAPASRRGVAPAGLRWAAVWSEEAAVTRSLSCLWTLAQCCHFHFPVTHFVDVVSFLLFPSWQHTSTGIGQSFVDIQYNLVTLI